MLEGVEDTVNVNVKEEIEGGRVGGCGQCGPEQDDEVVEDLATAV